MRSWSNMSLAERQKHTADVLTRQAAKRDMIREFKAERGCSVCGEMDPVVLDLHHRDPTEKNLLLRRDRPWLVRLGWEAIRVELDKCDVLCANCHRRHHAQEERPIEASEMLGLIQPTLWTD